MPPRADVVITLSEAYLQRHLADWLSGAWTSLGEQGILDVRPSGRLVLDAPLGEQFGLPLSAPARLQIHLDASGGRLTATLTKVHVAGLPVPQTLSQKLAQGPLRQLEERLNARILDALDGPLAITAVHTTDAALSIHLDPVSGAA